MRYIKVEWRHDDRDEPTFLYSELDDERWEVRKVEVYRDGTMGFADRFESAGQSRLGLTTVPELDEIAGSAEFRPEEITRDEFQSVRGESRVTVRNR